MKKLISLALALTLLISVFTIVPLSASAEAIDPDKAYVKVDGQYYEVEKGEIFSYTYKVGYEDARVNSIDIRINYDSAGLKFVPTLNEYGDEDYYAMFPVLEDSAVANFNNVGQILFNYSHVRGKKLTGENTTMFCGNFEVTADKGVYEIDGYIETLADIDMNKIVYKGEKILEYVEEQTLPELTPVEVETQEPTTEAPTVESTEPTEPTTEEPTVESTEPTEPTAEEPTVESTEPTEPTTEEPTVESTEPTEPTTEPTEESSQVSTEETTEIPTEESTEAVTDESTEAPTNEPREVKVYLVDEAGWGYSHIYAWNDGDEHAAWPGATMTFEGIDDRGNQIFSFIFPKAYENVIFNNGAGGKQTDDLNLVEGGFYNNLTEEWEIVPGDDKDPTEPTEPSTDPTQDPSQDSTDDSTQNPTTKPDDTPGAVFGDVDGDGETKVFDATLVQRYIAKSSALTEEQKLIADVDGDGEIKVFDATLIQRYVAKIE